MFSSMARTRFHLDEFACTNCTVQDTEVVKSRFQTKPWRSHDPFPEAFECADEIWRWVYMAVLPRHPLCSKYADWICCSGQLRWDTATGQRVETHFCMGLAHTNGCEGKPQRSSVRIDLHTHSNGREGKPQQSMHYAGPQSVDSFNSMR